MKTSIVLVATAFFCLFAFPTTTVGRNIQFWPKAIEGWPHPSEISKNSMFLSTSGRFNYGDSKLWNCTYSNGGPAISISTPYPETPLTPSPRPPTPKRSPPPPTPSHPPPKPKTSPPPPKPKKSPPPSPPPTTPSHPHPTPKKSPPPPPPSDDDDSSSPSEPSNPPPEHHHHHRKQNPLEHMASCMANMGDVMMCRGQMEASYYSKMFEVTDYCCNLIVNMRNECDDVIWGFFTDPYFVTVVRYTCYVNY